MTFAMAEAFTSEFVRKVAVLEFENVFNPYKDTCPLHDVVGAPEIRRRNLEVVIQAGLTHGVDSIWVGRDLGYRGGRRTGLALTDDIHLGRHAKLMGVDRLERATKGPLVAERTAVVVWRALESVNRRIFLWNVFPLHPHAASSPMSNRIHARREAVAGCELLHDLCSALQAKTIVAIGRDAQAVFQTIGSQVVEARHPSYGGQPVF
jgi:hypothetical protein